MDAATRSKNLFIDSKIKTNVFPRRRLTRYGMTPHARRQGL